MSLIENAAIKYVTSEGIKGNNENKYDAELLQKPDDINISFLRITGAGKETFPYAKFATGIPLKIGEPVLLVGLLSETLDFARGTYPCRIGAILDKPRTTYCLDSAIRFGFVAGPVFNTNNQIIGVIGFDLTPNEGGDLYVHSGHPLIYQANLFKKYIETPQNKIETSKQNNTEEAWLGIFTQPLNDDFAEYWKLPHDGGLIVSSVVQSSPAETAGFQQGDIITNFNDIPIKAKLDREVAGFTKLVRDSGTGKEVTIKFLRNGKPMETHVTLAGRPKSSRDAGEYKDEILGLTVREITTDVRIVLNLSEDVKGVIVRRIRSAGVADLAGMKPGVIIMGLGNHPVTSIEEFKQILATLAEKKPKEITAFCRAGAATGFFRLEPRWDATTEQNESLPGK